MGGEIRKRRIYIGLDSTNDIEKKREPTSVTLFALLCSLTRPCNSLATFSFTVRTTEFLTSGSSWLNQLPSVALLLLQPPAGRLHEFASAQSFLLDAHHPAFQSNVFLAQTEGHTAAAGLSHTGLGAI